MPLAFGESSWFLQIFTIPTHFEIRRSIEGVYNTEFLGYPLAPFVQCKCYKKKRYSTATDSAHGNARKCAHGQIRSEFCEGKRKNENNEQVYL